MGVVGCAQSRILSSWGYLRYGESSMFEANLRIRGLKVLVRGEGGIIKLRL